MNTVARDLPDIGFRPMRETDFDEVLSMEREACEFPCYYPRAHRPRGSDAPRPLARMMPAPVYARLGVGRRGHAA